MKLRVRKINPDGQIKLESGGEIKEVLINEDFLHPNEESISVCFRGKSSSGIIDFTPEEIARLYKSVRGKTHLIKGMKIFKG